MRPVPLKSSKWLLLLSVASCLLFVCFIEQSCRKADFYPSAANTDRSERFFRSNSNHNKVLNIIARLKAENDRTGFVNNIPAKSGYPIWEKTIRKAAANTLQRDGEDSSGTIIIPMTTTDEDLSSLLFVAERPDGTLDISCKTTNEYLYSLTHNNPADSTGANYNLTTFIFMEHWVFGTTRFYHIPEHLLPNIGTQDSHGDKTVVIKDDTTNSGSIVPTVWICVEYLYLCPVCGQYPCEAGYSFIYSICVPADGDGGGGGNPFPIPFPVPPFPPNLPSPPPHGGTGGGTNPAPPTPPTTPPIPPPPPNPNPPPPLPPDCLLNTWYSFTNLPNGNCMPSPADTILNPCAHADSLTQSLSFISYLQEMRDSLNSPTGNNREFGYLIYKGTDGAFGNTPDGLLAGTPNKLGLNDFHSPYMMDGIVHSHFNTGTDTTKGLPVFSPDDLWTMCGTFNVGNVKDPAIFTMALVTPHSQYLMKIENLTVFRTWAKKFSSVKLLFHYENFRRRKINPAASVEENEKLFLKFLQEYLGGSGLKLFRGNNTFTHWQPIKYNSGTDSVENAPCI